MTLFLSVAGFAQSGHYTIKRSVAERERLRCDTRTDYSLPPLPRAPLDRGAINCVSLYFPSAVMPRADVPRAHPAGLRKRGYLSPSQAIAPLRTVVCTLKGERLRGWQWCTRNGKPRELARRRSSTSANMAGRAGRNVMDVLSSSKRGTVKAGCNEKTRAKC